MDANDALDAPRLLISRTALLANVRLMRARMKPGTRICAVVKADAYGHGADVVVDALCNFGTEEGAGPAVDQLAVATLEEAAALPPVAVPVLVLRQVENVYVGRSRMALEQAIRQGWTLTLATPAAADDLARIAVAAGRRCGVHVMIDSGLSRCGVGLENVDALLSRIDRLEALRVVSLSTHFANAEVPGDAYTDWQLNRFLNVTDSYVRKNPRVIRHAANTGGVFYAPATHLDCVRPGIGLYGIDPSGEPSMERALRPVAKWVAPLIGVREIAEGTSVGYNQTFVASGPTRIGLVPVGYGDGYRRSFSNVGAMMVDGRLAPVLGRVSMDLTTINLTGAPHARVGDAVTIMDDDPLSPVSAYALSRWAGTIAYELFCGIGARSARVGYQPADAAVDQASPGRGAG
jgi:alanine racemase